MNAPSAGILPTAVAGQDVLNNAAGTAVQKGGIIGTPAISPYTLGSMGFGATNALLEIVRTKTAGKVIEAPQLIALDNEEATIQVGELVRYAETFVANTEGG